MIVETIPQIQSMSIQERFLLAAELWQELLRQAGNRPATAQLGRNLENKLARYQVMRVTGRSEAKGKA
jgi:hypothetical protein